MFKPNSVWPSGSLAYDIEEEDCKNFAKRSAQS